MTGVKQETNYKQVVVVDGCLEEQVEEPRSHYIDLDREQVQGLTVGLHA